MSVYDSMPANMERLKAVTARVHEQYEEPFVWTDGTYNSWEAAAANYLIERDSPEDLTDEELDEWDDVVYEDIKWARETGYQYDLSERWETGS